MGKGLFSKFSFRETLLCSFAPGNFVSGVSFEECKQVVYALQRESCD